MSVTTDLLRRLFLRGLDLVGDLDMLDAKVNRLAAQCGFSLDIPDRPGAEVTPEIRADILAARECYSEEEWLLNKGIRDQICVRFGLSRSQVAGVLSGASRRNGSGNGDGHSATEVEPEPVSFQTSMITENPTTWPALNGNGASPPKQPVRELDEIDWQIARAVLRADQWAQRRGVISSHRRLTGQQVAGMKAALTREARSS
jgi:hypothetical protein